MIGKKITVVFHIGEFTKGTLMAIGGEHGEWLITNVDREGRCTLYRYTWLLRFQLWCIRKGQWVANWWDRLTTTEL